MRIILRNKSRANSSVSKIFFFPSYSFKCAFKHLESLKDSFKDTFYLKVKLCLSHYFSARTK